LPLSELVCKSLYLFSEWLPVVFRRLRADVTAGREHMPVLPDVLNVGIEAKAGHVCVFAGLSVAPPGIVPAIFAISSSVNSR
jgi:hypothetical protein